MGDWVVIEWPDAAVTVELADGVTYDDATAAAALLGASLRSCTDIERTTPRRTAHDASVEAVLASLTPAETGVLTELAHRPDTRSRLAARLGVSPSTLDNHLAAIKRKLLDHLETAGQGPKDGYLSMEAVIGWATRNLGQ
jgi:DNA-binding CsgD family transcriptional regulator